MESEDEKSKREAKELKAKKAGENSVKGFFLTISWWAFIAFLVLLVLGVVTNGFEFRTPDLGYDTLPPSP